MKFIPYLLFLKNRQNFKLLSAANYMWRFYVLSSHERGQGYSRKKYLVGEEGKRYIFLSVVGADIFQIIWVIGV